VLENENLINVNFFLFGCCLIEKLDGSKVLGTVGN
jgi:hypothetical protein